MRRPRYCRGNHSPRCQISFSCFRFSFFPPGWLIFLFQYTIPCAEKQNPAFFIVFLSFTHEKQHFMQFCLLDSPQKCYNCINRTSIFFQHPKEVFVCCLIVSLRCVFWVTPYIRGGGIDSPRPASQRAAAFILTAAMLTTLAAPAFAKTWCTSRMVTSP